MTIKTDGIWFKDEHGRTLILRGVNLGGSTKVPVARRQPGRQHQSAGQARRGNVESKRFL